MDHQAAVLGNALQQASRGVGKRYCVTVEFAHGIQHELTVDREVLDTIEAWLNRSDDPWLTLRWEHGAYVFNREYLCSLVIRMVDEGATS